MTQQEIDNHDKIQAEIANLITKSLTQNAEAEKYRAETAKIYKDLKWYEIILLISGSVAFTALIAVLTKVFF